MYFNRVLIAIKDHSWHGKVPKVGKGMLDFVEDIFVGVKSH